MYVLENLGYGCRDAGLLFAVATQLVSAATPLQKFGSDDLKERYLRRLIDGEIISAHAISEPSAGSDAMAMITTATEDGDSFILDGSKIFITSGPIADVITVYAKQDTGEGAAGITAFLVETDTPGFNVGEPFPKLGLNTCPFCQLEFREVRVPKDNIVGKPGAGFFILEHVMNWEILGIFMMMVGEMQWRMEACIDWAKKRSGVRLADRLQPVRRRQDRRPEDRPGELAEASLRHGSPVCQGPQRDDRDLDGEADHQRGEPAVRACRPCRSSAAAATCRNTGIEKSLRDAIGAPIYSGTNEMQRVRIASMLGL